MDISQTNQNELQQAIEDITSGAAPQDVPSNDAVAELEAKIQGQMGAPAAPPVPELPTAEATPAVEPAPALAPVEETPEVAAEPAAEAPTIALESEAEAATPAEAVPGDLGAVKDAMLRDLFPLMDKVELSAERKYELYKQALDKDGDKNLIPAAYEAVKGIADEAEKAAALLYLVELAEG